MSLKEPARLKFILIIILVLCFYLKTEALEIKGVISSRDGKSIPYASIYIKELTTGTTSNVEGEYSLELEPGTYTMFFQALGFSRVEKKVVLNSENIEENITLTSQDYRINEVRVYSGKEDPAYSIMRKSISLAPYFLRQVKHYKSNVYLKGGFDMNKIPRLFRKQLKEDGFVEGKSYVTESINEIDFDSPDKYTHKQISRQSTMPDNNENQVLQFINYSFYDSDNDLAITPLARNAFSLYRFRYEGFFQQGDHYVNKIKVTPKKKNQKLFEGYIYIVDGLWNLHSLDLVNEQFFGKIRVHQVLEQVEGNAWLPVSHHFNVDVKIMGFNVTANYGGSVKYNEVVLDEGLPVPQSLIEAYHKSEEEEESIVEEEEVQPVKAQSKIETLMSKKDLSNREMMKLSRLLEKENREKEREGKGLQLDSWEDTYIIVKDTVERDSVDWNKIRPIPLSKKEIESFGIRDSVTLAKSGVNPDSLKEEKQRSRAGILIGGLMTGRKYYVADSAITIRHKGLFTPNVVDFNSVDGWSFVQDFVMRYRFKEDTKRIDFIPQLKYSFGNKQLMWKFNSYFYTSFINHTRIEISAANISSDFNDVNGIAPFINSASSLLFKENYMKLYQNKYLGLGFRTDIANGLQLKLGAQYKETGMLQNSTEYSFFNEDKVYRPNEEIASINTNDIVQNKKIFQLESEISYTPEYYYRISNGVKRMVESDYPTFTLKYKGGFDGIFNTDSRFDLLEFSVKQDIDWSFMYNLNYELRTGYYFSNSSMHFSDYTHFNTSEVPVSFKDWKRNFNLLNDYEYSTKKWYLEGHLSYSTPYLIVKNIPFLQDKLWNENLYLHHLTQPDFKNYNELGYGISQIFLLVNVGVFAGFDDFEYSNWGVRFSLKFGEL